MKRPREKAQHKKNTFWAILKQLFVKSNHWALVASGGIFKPNWEMTMETHYRQEENSSFKTLLLSVWEVYRVTAPSSKELRDDQNFRPSHTCHTVFITTKDRKQDAQRKQKMKIARRTNYGMKDFQTLCSRAKCVPIPTSTLALKLLLCIAYQVCTCYHDCYHHTTQKMLMLLFLWFSTTNKQPNTTHWS